MEFVDKLPFIVIIVCIVIVIFFVNKEAKERKIAEKQRIEEYKEKRDLEIAKIERELNMENLNNPEDIKIAINFLNKYEKFEYEKDLTDFAECLGFLKGCLDTAMLSFVYYKRHFPNLPITDELILFAIVVTYLKEHRETLGIKPTSLLILIALKEKYGVVDYDPTNK